jgi:hypothetical protein
MFHALGYGNEQVVSVITEVHVTLGLMISQLAVVFELLVGHNDRIVVCSVTMTVIVLCPL